MGREPWAVPVRRGERAGEGPECALESQRSVHMDLTPNDPEMELVALQVVFTGGASPESENQLPHDLLTRRAPVEALAVLEPALAQEPKNTGLRSRRAWAYLIRVQLGRAEEGLRSLGEDDPSDVWARHALGRAL